MKGIKETFTENFPAGRHVSDIYIVQLMSHMTSLSLSGVQYMGYFLPQAYCSYVDMGSLRQALSGQKVCVLPHGKRFLLKTLCNIGSSLIDTLAGKAMQLHGGIVP